MGGFKNISQGEGQRLVAYNDKQIELTKCDNCMCCVVHNDNTINKDRFYEKSKVDNKFLCEPIKEILNRILDIDYVRL